MSLDPRNFRRALGKFATGVTVVTVLDSLNEKIGVTASSFNTVSIDPPLILWSVDKSAYSAEVFRNAEHFVVNVLANDQVDISNKFARKGEDKFAGVECSDGVANVPKINGAVACFECRTWNVYDGGDHHIIVGEVLNFHSDESRSSLVFHNGRYAVPEQHPVTKEIDKTESIGGLLGKSLIYLLRQAHAQSCDRFYPKLSNYGVTAEEWRILTLLGDRGQMNADDVGALVMQPPKELRDTVAWLRDKGYIEPTTGDAINLTDQGRALSHRLLDMARDFEKNELGSLSGEDVQLLKTQLCQIGRSQTKV